MDTFKKSEDLVLQQHAARDTSEQNTFRIMQNLEHQILLYEEDVESEKREKEKAQCRVKELEQELRITRRQLDTFQSCQGREIEERRDAAMRYYREEYERQHPNYQHLSYLEDEPEETGEGLDEIDAPANKVQHLKKWDIGQQRTEAEDMLHCGRCGAAFPISQHEKLIEHAEECS